MSQMHQMQLSYVPTEDRMLFRLNTKEGQEFRFWMTRRYAGILWNTLAKLIAEADQAQKTADPGNRTATLKDTLAESAQKEMQHQEVVSQADFETLYQESGDLPLGEAPALLFGVGIKPNALGQATLCLHPEKDQGIEIVLNEQILHSLCQLIIETSKKAGWQLALRFAQPDGGPGGIASGPGLN